MSSPDDDSRTGRWHREWFDRDYLRLYAHRDDGEAAGLLRALRDGHGLAPRAAGGRWTRVLDAGCGAGRHSLQLARQGFRVVGLDWSRPLLEEARRALLADPPDPEPLFVRGDLARPPFRGGFDWVLSLFTSFGYSERDAVNEGALAALQGQVAPGGRLVLDYLNPARLRRTLVPESRRRVEDWEVVESRRVDEGANMVVKDIRFGPPGVEPRRVTERVKLYEPAWFLERSAGFRLLAHAGTLDGGPWTPDSERSLLLLERSAP